ncbi:NADPH-dependent FMN reductase [Asticcacaulis solisilvae]|uniref:NADPH-dependent FMN reductase n=1 Tax=Asticcacaulis solisilvae TaxID=1217274 RepID=UPI003FD7E225
MKLAALNGSLRNGSINAALIEAIRRMGMFDVETVSTVLPPFTPDHADDAPSDVLAFRACLNAADAILIATPEYAMGIPGMLKNAIDWTVGSCEFAHKPTALITCTSSGEIAHPALLEVLRVLEARMTEDTALLLNHNRAKVRPNATFVTPEAEAAVRNVVEALRQLCTT